MEKGDRADTEGSGFMETVHVRRLFQGICYVVFFFFNSYSLMSFVFVFVFRVFWVLFTYLFYLFIVLIYCTYLFFLLIYFYLFILIGG